MQLTTYCRHNTHNYGRCFWPHSCDERPLLPPPSTSATLVHPGVEMRSDQAAPATRCPTLLGARRCFHLSHSAGTDALDLYVTGRFSYPQLCLQVCFPVQLSKMLCCPAQVTTAGIRPHASTRCFVAQSTAGSGIQCCLLNATTLACRRLPPLPLFFFFFVRRLGLTVRTLPHPRLSCRLGGLHCLCWNGALLH